MTTYNGRTLIAGFALLAVVATAGTVALVGGGVEELSYAFATGIGGAVVVIGVYGLTARRGIPHSHSVVAAGVSLGVLYMIVLVYRLLTKFPA